MTDRQSWGFLFAWANGNLRAPQTWIRWIADAVKAGTNPNLLTVSIGWAGYHGGGTWIQVMHGGKTLQTLQRGSIRQRWVPPEAQYQAGLWLHRQLIAPRCPGGPAAHLSP